MLLLLPDGPSSRADDQMITTNCGFGNLPRRGGTGGSVVCPTVGSRQLHVPEKDGLGAAG